MAARGLFADRVHADEEGDEDDEHPVAFSQMANQRSDVFAAHMRDHSRVPRLPNGTNETTELPPLSAAPPRRHGKLVNDTIHGLMRIDPNALAIVDTPEFQRLRDLKQLGLSHYVYPCASHSRFEHSLGTYALADGWVTHFQQCQPELGIGRKERTLVTLAGLCHDLGHGPFSHLWDNEVLPRLRELGRIDADREWSHEWMSCELLEHLFDENGLEDRLALDSRDGLVRADLRAIEELISIDKRDYDSAGRYHGRHSGRPQLQLGGKMYLYEIVANGRNSVDIDKFDYLLRDGRACSVQPNFDHRRLMQLSKVINNKICFKGSEVYTLYNMFNTRANLHQVVYTHAKAKAIEFMVTDALVAADRHYRFNELIWEPARFKTIDDTLLKRIEWSTDDDLAQARAIVSRLRRRDLYKFAGEVTVPDHMHASWARVRPADIVSKAPSGSALRECDVIVDNKEINYSMKSKDPVSNVDFFDNLDSTSAAPLGAEKVSAILPRVFQDKKVRLFVRDAAKLADAQAALNSFAKSRQCTSPIGNTPVKRARADEGGGPHSASRARALPGLTIDERDR